MTLKTVFLSSVLCVGLAFAQEAGKGPTQAAPASFADVVEPLLPAVVNISTTSEAKRDKRQDMMQQFPGPGMPMDEFLKQFFGDNMPGGKPRKAMSLGSGFIVAQEKDEFIIVTCHHVIAEADEIKVTFHKEPKEYTAEVVGRDARTDVAVLKVKVPNKTYPVVQWGDSDKSRVGDWVIAIGNPFGLESTVTKGIISTVARDITAGARLGTADYVSGYFQTDAAINMGNSGGPLFNMDGKLIGINTAILSPNGGNIGIGFVIPSNIVQKVADQLRQFGRTKRGWIGVYIQHITPEMADSFGLPSLQGALVPNVTKDGPSDKAGIKSGDVILEFNGAAVKDWRHLQQLVGEAPIGKKAPVVLWRNGKKETAAVDVLEFEKAQDQGMLQAGKEQKPEAMSADTAIMHMLLQEPKPVLLEQFGLPADTTGLVITGIDPDSEADMKALRPGDVVVQLSHRTRQVSATSLAAVKQFIQDLRKEKVTQVVVLVKTRGNLRYLTLQLNEKEPVVKKSH
jgi:serine protease Do